MTPHPPAPPLDSLLPLLAHEMRTPLCAIVGLADLLLEPSAPLAPEAQRDALRDILRAGERLSRLVDDCVALWRTQSTPSVRPRPTPVAPLVEEALAETPAHPGVRIETELDPGLPPILADPDRIVQVLVNLITNAVRHAPAGSRVRVQAMAAGGAVWLAVHDEGPGLDAAARARLFEPFGRGRDPGAGLGLGLYLCKLLVEAHGGSIAIDTTPAIGTTARITIPSAG